MTVFDSRLKNAGALIMKEHGTFFVYQPQGEIGRLILGWSTDAQIAEKNAIVALEIEG